MGKKIITLMYDDDTDTTTILKSKTLEDCPASECDGEECECYKEMYGKALHPLSYDKPKKPNESLYEKLLFHLTKVNKDTNIMGWQIVARNMAQESKEHYQEHPEEIHESDSFIEFIDAVKEINNIYRRKFKGMVSIDEVLRVFDEVVDTYGAVYTDLADDYTEQIRKALENMEEK